MNKKITSTALAALMIAGSTSFSALAAMSSGTVVIGAQAFSFAYANDVANLGAITDAIVANGAGAVYVKNFTGNWINNATGAAVAASVIPAVVYTNAEGTTDFAAGDVDVDVVTEATIKEVTATNGTVTAELVEAQTKASVASNFVITQKIGDGVATTVVPTAFTVVDNNNYKFTTPLVAGAATVQSVVYSVSYLYSAPVSSKAVAIAAVTTEPAVAAYEAAPIVTGDNVVAAETLGAVAKASVALVTDAATKTAFTTRLATKDAFVATARTAQEKSAIALINNSTEYNIIARLQASVLNLQGIDATYAKEYQAARVANFTTTKALIQANVIDFAKTATDLVLKADLKALNESVTAYINAVNVTAQTTATTSMKAALALFTNHYALTGYVTANDSAYMIEFAKSGTLTTLAGVNTVIKNVNKVVTAAATATANLTAAKTTVAALFTTTAKTALTTTTTQVLITAALVNVNKLADTVTEKAGLLVDVQNAQGLFDASIVAADLSAANTAVLALFTGSDKTIVNSATTQVLIDAATVKINKLSDVVTEKAGLVVDVQKAQSLFDASIIEGNITAAETAVAGLFEAGDVTKLNTTIPTTQVLIDAALVKVNKLSDSITEKAGLLVDVKAAQTLFTAQTAKADLTAAQTTVTALFEAGAKTKLNTVTPTTQVLITAALANVNKLGSTVTEKAGLLVDVQSAQTLFTAAIASANLDTAKTTVAALFVAGAKTVVNPATTQALIDAALVNVNKLAVGVSEKAGLLVDVQSAQTLYTVANAAKNLTAAKASVEALFENYTTKVALKVTPATTQDNITAALADVNKLAVGVTEKAGLTADVTAAQSIFDKASEASRLKAVNDATILTMNAALLNVGIAQDPTYVNFSSNTKSEIAQLVFAAKPTAGFTNTTAVITEIATQNTVRTTLIANVNAATTITAMNAALDVAQLPAFKALSAVQKVNVAETVLIKLNALKAATAPTNFKSILDINTAAGL